MMDVLHHKTELTWNSKSPSRYLRLLGHRATPIKCLDLDDKGGQLKLEGWLYIDLIFLPLIMRSHHFIGNFGDDAPFYW